MKNDNHVGTNTMNPMKNECMYEGDILLTQVLLFRKEGITRNGGDCPNKAGNILYVWKTILVWTKHETKAFTYHLASILEYVLELLLLQHSCT
jgi:hypothetical protein